MLAHSTGFFYILLHTPVAIAFAERGEKWHTDVLPPCKVVSAICPAEGNNAAYVACTDWEHKTQVVKLTI
jgi:hypothetical protein